MKSIISKTLDKYHICEECGKIFVKRVYEEFAYKPLCSTCRTPHAAIVARREFNAASKGWCQIVPAVSA
jgi:ribosomal protein L37AE/L43A